MSTMTLTEFLLARIEESQLRAQAAVQANPSWGRYFADGGYTEVRDEDGRQVASTVASEVCAHVTANDPARVLADCDAKRRIVKRHGGKHVCPTPPDEWHRYEGGERVDYEIPCGDLRDLAAPFADHPDYREEWKP